ncbi:MAG: transposase [Clostridium sp.]
MARKSRVKIDNGIYHIIVKSVKDRLMFKSDADKAMFMEKLKQSKTKYPFKLYAYCLMDNHAHLLIDSQNQDISTIMKSLNLRYVKFYNFKYDLDSRLFKERFRSEIIDSDEYLTTVSLYIHRNAKDLPGYRECPNEYLFSSLRVYFGEKDPFDVVEVDRILSLMSKNKRKARKEYKTLFETNMRLHVESYKDIKLNIELEEETFTNEKGILKQDYTVDDVIEYVCENEKIQPIELVIKNRSKNKNARAMVVLLATAVCGEKCKDIAIKLGNLTVSRVSQLCNIAIELVLTNDYYRDLFKKFVM